MIPPNLNERYLSFSVVKMPDNKKGSLMTSFLSSMMETGIISTSNLLVTGTLSAWQPNNIKKMPIEMMMVNSVDFIIFILIFVNQLKPLKIGNTLRFPEVKQWYIDFEHRTFPIRKPSRFEMPFL